MKIDAKDQGRRRIPRWVYALTVGLALMATATIVFKNASFSDRKFHWNAADDDGMTVAETEPPIVDEDDDDDHATNTSSTTATTANTTSERKGKTILMSLGSSTSPVSAPAVTRTLPAAKPTTEELIARAKRELSACRERYAAIRDYTCVFHKHERIDGKMSQPHVMLMKARADAIYFRFHQPNKGREAIYVPTKHEGKIVAHEPGMLRLVAGTMYLDPRGTMAMEENRHPISEAGIGKMIETITERWNVELDPLEAKVEFHPHIKVGDRVCRMVATIHPTRQPSFLFHKVKLFIDQEHGLPIRFEAYDWPKTPGAEPDLMEEYTFSDLKIDSGLTDRDFDPKNPQYSYGRF